MPRIAILLMGLTGCSSATPVSPTPATQVAATKIDSVPVIVASPEVKPTREGSDWPRFLGPNDDGSSPEKGILMKWPETGLRKLWDCPLGIGYAPPAIVSGKVYHCDRFGDAIRTTCRNAETGERIWSVEYPTDYEDFYGYEPGPRSGPVVDGDRVYIIGPEGKFVCYSTADGKELWKIDIKSKYHVHQNFFGVGSAPLIVGDHVLMPVGGSPKGERPIDFRDAKGNGTAIVAFDKLTGDEKWSVSDELSSYSSPIVAKIHGKLVGLYYARGGLLGFDPATGKQQFHFPWRARILESVNASNPVVIGDRIVVSECYEKGTAVVKLTEAGKIEPIWTDEQNDRLEKILLSHWCTPIADGGVIYGCSGRHTPEGELRCIDLATGDVKWRERRTTRCTLIKIDGHLLSLGENGELRLIKLDPMNYQQVAKWTPDELEYPCWAPPAVSRGLLYLRGKGKLACYELIPPAK